MNLSKSPRNLKKPHQGRASDIYLNKLMSRRRGIKSTRSVARKYLRILKIFIPIVLIITLLILLFSYLNKKEYFVIRDYEIQGAVNFVNQNDLGNLVKANVLGKKIFSLDLNNLKKLLEENFLGAKHISIQRISFNKIKVVVEERIPLAILHSTVDQKKYLIDADGYVLGEISEQFSNLPEVNYSKSILTGSFVEKDIAPLTIDLLAFAEKENLKVSSISFNPKYMRLYVQNGVEVLMGNNKNLEKYLGVVSSLIKRSNLEGKKVLRIDLRYDKVIVSYD